MILIRIVSIEIDVVRKNAGPYQYGQRQQCDHDLKHGVQSVRHRVCVLIRRAIESLLTLPASAAPHLASRSKKYFFTMLSQLRNFALLITSHHPDDPKVVGGKAKRPPGNRVASSLGRIVPTEAKPSELSGEILSLAKYRVKAKTCLL
jgi:hypothetical protein